MPPLLIFSFCSLLLDSFLDLESASAVLNSRIPLVRSEQGYQKKRAYQGDLGSPLSKTSVRARGFATVKAYHRQWLRLIIDNCLSTL